MTYLVAERLINFLLYIYNLPGEAQAELLPCCENGYFDENWTDKDCEF